MRRVILVDTTLRDGAQAAGVCLNHDDRKRIALAIAGLGIEEMEIGIPAMGEQECAEIAEIVAMLPAVNVSVWCRAREEDLAMARQCRCPTVHVSFPLSDIHLGALNKGESWLFDHLEFMVQALHGCFPRFTIGCQDASRAPRYRLRAFTRMALSLGAARVRIADTVGILNPQETHELIRDLLDTIPGAALEFHGHNDLGMATANAFMALRAGAEAVSVTVNGMGERAGNVAIEEIVMALATCPDELPCGVDISNIGPVSDLVARLTNRAVSAWKPVVGSEVFTHSSGIHCHGLCVDSRTYEPFDPESVGRQPSRMVAGTHTGSSGVQAILKQQGKSLTREQAHGLARRVRTLAQERKKSLTGQDLEELLSEEVCRGLP